MVTLGFDASTTCVGWSYVSDEKIIDAGYIDISKFETPKEKTYAVLDSLSDKRVPERINIEAPLSGFSGGRTSQQVIIQLVRFNAIFEYILTDKFYPVPIHLVNVNTARKSLFGKARVKGIKSKDYVKQEIEKRFDTSKWVHINRAGNFDKKNIDMYDAIVLACYDK